MKMFFFKYSLKRSKAFKPVKKGTVQASIVKSVADQENLEYSESNRTLRIEGNEYELFYNNNNIVASLKKQ